MEDSQGKKILFMRIFLFFGMVICFSLQSLESFEKFVAGKTSISESEEERKAKPLPSFSICPDPPFDSNLLESELNVSSSFFFFSQLMSGNKFPPYLNENLTLQNIWMRSSIRVMMYSIGLDRVFNDQFYDEVNNIEIDFMHVMNSLWFGRCTFFGLKRKRIVNEQLVMFLGYPTPRKPEKFNLILHETPGSRFSLIPGNYLSHGSEIIPVKLGEFTTIVIDEQIKNLNVQKRNKVCKDYDPQDSRSKCYVQKVIVPQWESNNWDSKNCPQNMTNLCKVPQAENIFELMKNESQIESFCDTEAEYKCMIMLLETKLQLQDEFCPRPCTETKFSTKVKGIPHDKSNIAFVQMYYHGERVSHLEEYLIFDFSSIVVAIGGSMGLFLGFSFFQCGTQFFALLLKFLRTLIQKIS